LPPAGLAAQLAGKLNAVLSQSGLDQKIDDTKVTPETKAELAKLPKGRDLLRLNRAMLSEAYPDEVNSLSDAFYNHPLIKSLARPGSHPSYVPSKTFARTLLDIFSKGQAAAATAEQRVAQIKANIENLPDSDVKKSLQALLMHGADSVEQVEDKLASWFDDSMDRVSGWYKNRVQVWTVIIASLVTVFANADTIEIARKLMINPTLRDKIAAEAKGASGGNSPTLTEQEKADLSGLAGWSEEFRVFHRFDACADVKMRADNESEWECRGEPIPPASRKPTDEVVAARKAASNNDSFPGMGLFSATFFPWLWAIVPGHLVGWIFSAIAASLGAPFWFDTLNKFMNVRAAGTAPNEKDSDISKK